MSDKADQIFDFIVNRRGGTVLEFGEDTVRQEILSAFGEKAGTFTFVEGKDIASTVRNWAAAHAGENRGLVVGGGDGTVITAAEQILGRDDITLGVLPLGTQNLVARRLGFSADFRKAAAQYKNGKSVDMDIGEVNGLHFLLMIAIDKNIVNIFEAREASRDGKRLSLFKKSLSAAHGLLAVGKESFRISTQRDDVSGTEVKGKIIVITNNNLKPEPIKLSSLTAAAIRDAVTNIAGANPESTGELSLYAFKGGLLRIASILPEILKGKWDNHRSVKRQNAPEFFVHAPEGAVERQIILDGEIKKVQYPLEVKIIPAAVKMFKPG